MSLKAIRKKGGSVPPLDGGTYPACCVGVVDLGEQYEKYMGEKNGKYISKVLLIFEVLGETVEVEGEQKPRWLSAEYALSLSQKANLYRDLVSWRGRDFTEEELAGYDLSRLAGEKCILTVIVKETKDGGQYNRITGIAGAPRGIQIGDPESEILIYDIDERNEEVFDKLPEWVRKKIQKSTQFALEPPEERESDDTHGAQNEEANPI